jgi:hypothetical protein
MRSPFLYFNSSPEVIRLTVMLYIRYALSLRQVEDLLFERGIDIWTVRFWSRVRSDVCRGARGAPGGARSNPTECRLGGGR